MAKGRPILDCVGCFTSAPTLFQHQLTNAALNTSSLAPGLGSYDDSRGVALGAPVKRVKNTGTLDLVGTCWLDEKMRRVANEPNLRYRRWSLFRLQEGRVHSKIRITEPPPAPCFSCLCQVQREKKRREGAGKGEEKRAEAPQKELWEFSSTLPYCFLFGFCISGAGMTLQSL